MSTLNVGDRVRIVKSYYAGDPSRMAGGTGTVVKTYDNDYGVNVRVDNDPGDYDEDMEWTFPVEFLEKIEEPETGEVKVGDRVRIVETYFTETAKKYGPSEAMYPGLIGATGTAIEVYRDAARLRLDRLTEGWEVITVPKVEKVEPEQATFEVGDLVSIGKDKTHHGFAPGTVARVLEVYGDASLFVTTRPEDTDKYLWWENGVTAYVNHEPDEYGREDAVRLVAKAGSEGAVLPPLPVSYQEFVDTVAQDGLVTAFERFNITHK